jgi:hypothetical protein
MDDVDWVDFSELTGCGGCPNLRLEMSHLGTAPDGSIRLVADRRLFARSLVRHAAATVVEQCHVHLDLDDEGAVVVTLTALVGDDDAGLRAAAGHFGNLLVAQLASSKLDAQTLTARNLIVARALDGALPRATGPEAE